MTMTLEDHAENEKGDRQRIHDTTGRTAPEHPDDVANAAVEAGQLIEEIQRAKITDDPDELWLANDRKLPGFGDRGDNCGDDFARFCPDCGSVSEWGQTCYRSTCPRCAPSWARRLATSYCSQLEQVRRVRQSNRDRHQRFHHVVVSPPAEWHPDAKEPGKKWQKGAEVVQRVLETCDLEGLIVYHPYRGKGEDGDDRGEWKDRLNSGRDWADVRDELKWSPHYHCLVVGHKIPGGGVTRAVESMTGWLIERITKADSNVSLYDEYDLARAVSYCLSHAGLYRAGSQTRVCEKRAGEKLKRGNSPTWNPDENDEDDRLRRQYDAVVRSVAPKTLGLEYNNLACSSDLDADDADDDHAEKCDLDHAEGSARVSAGHSPSSSSDVSERNRTELPDEAPERSGELREIADQLPDRIATTGDDLDPEDLESLSDDDLPAGVDREAIAGLLESDDAETTRCEGRLISIAKAPQFVDDPEWRASAPYADELRESYQKWTERLDWLG